MPTIKANLRQCRLVYQLATKKKMPGFMKYTSALRNAVMLIGEKRVKSLIKADYFINRAWYEQVRK